MVVARERWCVQEEETGGSGPCVAPHSWDAAACTRMLAKDPRKQSLAPFRHIEQATADASRMQERFLGVLDKQEAKERQGVSSGLCCQN